jgi:two-component system response regulator YesN
MGIDMIETLKPDIAIIDIRMPLMDGLELINNVRKKNIPIKFIILSGYDDFYYAQKAIELKAVSYLLKPCSIEDMLRAVMRAANIIDTEKKQENLLKSYQEFINKNLPILREKLLVAIIEKQYNDAQVQNDIKKRISNYNLDLPGKYYFVCVLSLDGFDVLSLDYETQGIDYIFFTLTELIRQMLQQRWAQSLTMLEFL